MAAQPAQVLDVALRQGLQWVVAGKTGIDAHPNLGPGVLVEPPKRCGVQVYAGSGSSLY